MGGWLAGWLGVPLQRLQLACSAFNCLHSARPRRRAPPAPRSDPVLAGIMARWCSPPEVVVAGDARTAYYLHLLCALTRRHEVVV